MDLKSLKVHFTIPYWNKISEIWSITLLISITL